MIRLEIKALFIEFKCVSSDVCFRFCISIYICSFIRENAPNRSAELCEDRVVLEPSVRRLYPPSLLEWRINYTGTHMGIKLTFPDGKIKSIFRCQRYKYK